MKSVLFAALAFLSLALPCYGETSSDNQHLASQRVWRGLLGYNILRSGPPAQVSDIVSPEFFLSPTGMRDPAAELDATLKALSAPVGPDPETHAQCRFPARLLWLKSQHVLPDAIPAVDCKKYKAFLTDKPPTSASLIFASGHLSNPATFYGHMLLRLTSSEDVAPNVLLESTLNYGAIFPENENPVVYVGRGLTGGYGSTFSVMNFYQHLHRYNEVQNRDVWEYRLHFRPDQIALMSAHAYERLRIFNRYYYLKENCAYRIAELISLVVDEPIVPDDKPWVMPVEVLEKAATARNDNQPLVTAVVRLSSRQTQLNDRFQVLSAPERRAATAFLKRPMSDPEQVIGDLKPAAQARVLETLIDFYNVSEAEAIDKAGEGRISEEAKRARQSLLRARLKRAPGRADFGPPIAPPPPHSGQKPTLFQVTGFRSKEDNTGAELRFRAAYNDFLSISPGALPNSELSFGDVRVLLKNNRLRLRSLEAVRITTLSVAQPGLEQRQSKSWRMVVGAESERLNCQACLEGMARFGIGHSQRIGPFVSYGLAEGKVTVGGHDRTSVWTGLTVGSIYNQSGPLRASAEGTYWTPVGEGKPYFRATVETRMVLTPQADFTVGAIYEDRRPSANTEWRIGVAFYR